MAYVSKEKKAKIVSAFKNLNLPKCWKVSFSVDNHSTIVATIMKAPSFVKDDFISMSSNDRLYVNHYHLDKCFKGKTFEILQNLIDVMNIDNYDKSDIMSDYHDVGHYVQIQFGKWNKPCVFGDEA